jgi:hypothetical protein
MRKSPFGGLGSQLLPWPFDHLEALSSLCYRFLGRLAAVVLLFGVQDPNGFAVQTGFGVLKALRIELAPRLAHSVSQMGRKNGVIRGSEWMVPW